MATGRRETPPCSKTYGFPIYCAAWVPLAQISAAAAAEKVEEEKKEGDAASEGGGGGDSSASTDKGDRLLVALGGGGGEGRSGVPNVVVISQFDVPSRSLAEQPVFRMETERDVPYRMAVHPGGDGIIFSFPKSCRWFQWDFSQSRGTHNLSLRSSGEALTQLKDVGQQLALSFDEEGSLLATGSEDGHLRIFKWPSMENILEETVDNTTLKDLDFSSDGKFLVSLRNSGPCRVWDLISSTVKANLPREDGEIFGFCRFSRSADNSQILFITAMHGDQGKIISWDTISWNRVGSKRIVRDPISAFNVSPDGKHLAIGTIEGTITILRTANMQVQMTVKRAHLGIVTGVVFSQDSRALMSSSFDSTVRVTILESKNKNAGFSLWMVILIIILAMLAYYIKLKADL
ncbi:SEC12-like protein 2 isoform X1 [Typha latifolia]|uniref:SEC12-like protein 2 isoform X1 n=1 Tax=Typha latifolia TaxID=4733 RepID=UPI003C2B0D83